MAPMVFSSTFYQIQRLFRQPIWSLFCPLENTNRSSDWCNFSWIQRDIFTQRNKSKELLNWVGIIWDITSYKPNYTKLRQINFFSVFLLMKKKFRESWIYLYIQEKAASVPCYESYRERSVTTQTLMSSNAYTKAFTTMNVDCHFQDHTSPRWNIS